VTGKKCAANFLETMSILFDDFLRWCPSVYVMSFDDYAT